MNDGLPFALPALVVLMGPSGSGKSTWAAARFADGEVVSSDGLRAQVGWSRHDLDASADAFDLLERIIDRRLARGLTTVVDTLGLDEESRRRWATKAAAAGLPRYLVRFTADAEVCRRRNAGRTRPVPASALRRQLARMAQQTGAADEGLWNGVQDLDTGGSVETTNVEVSRSAPDGGGRVDVSLGRFAGGVEPVLSMASDLEQAGVSRLWLMDHQIQVPQVGRHWEDIPEPYTALGYLAGVTSAVGLGVLVSPVSLRNPGLIARSLATLDVVSGGRAVCGLGAGWFEREHGAMGVDFPPARRRLDMLEDAAQAVKLYWGPGSPPFEGITFSTPEAISYPRPVHGDIPVVIGGGGEERTLRIAARYGDAANLMGPAPLVARKVAVLRDHCREADRDPAEVEVTHLMPVLTAANRGRLVEMADALRPSRRDVGAFLQSLTNGTPDQVVDVMESLVEMGVERFVLAPVDTEAQDLAERIGSVVALADRRLGQP